MHGQPHIRFLKLIYPTITSWQREMRPLAPLQPEETHMILIERKVFLTPDSVWAFSRKEKSLAYAGNRTTASRLSTRQTLRCNYCAIQSHNNVVSNTFVAIYVRSKIDASPWLDFMFTMGIWLRWKARKSRINFKGNVYVAALANDATLSFTSKSLLEKAVRNTQLGVPVANLGLYKL